MGHYHRRPPRLLREQNRAVFGGWARLTSEGWQFDVVTANGDEFSVCQTRCFDVEKAAESLAGRTIIRQGKRTVQLLDRMNQFNAAIRSGRLGYLKLGAANWGGDRLEGQFYGLSELRPYIFESPAVLPSLPVVEVVAAAKVTCSNRYHTVAAMSDGTLALPDHPDMERQRVIDTLNGTLCRCREAEIAWSLHMAGINRHGSVTGVPTGLRSSIRNIRFHVFSSAKRYVVWQG